MVQTLDSALVILGSMLNILKVPQIGFWVDFDFQLRECTNLETLVFITGMKSKMNANEVQQCVDQFFWSVISKNPYLPHFLLLFQRYQLRLLLGSDDACL